MRRDPNNPLSPNYKYVPVAYHSRASSVRPSDVPIRRPSGQRKLPNEEAPSYGPCRKLDYELELAVWVGPGNRQGEPIPIGVAGEHIFGLGLVNEKVVETHAPHRLSGRSGIQPTEYRLYGRTTPPGLLSDPDRLDRPRA